MQGKKNNSGTFIWVNAYEYARLALGIKVKMYLSCIVISQWSTKENSNLIKVMRKREINIYGMKYREDINFWI